MTFSIAAHCEKTGMFGFAVSSSSPAVAARCAFARANVGAVGSQNITDPSLGERCLDLMESGMSSQQAIDEIVKSAANIEYRQLTAIDQHGNTAVYSGGNTLGIHASYCSSNVVCAGNMLADDQVPTHMANAFAKSDGHLGKRLVDVMLAGVAAGGEAGPVHSAGLLLVDQVSWPVASLRVDWNADAQPIQELARLWEIYQPQLDDYVSRALDPSKSPSYGVPGDE